MPFVKGRSGNPAGRPRSKYADGEDVRSLARKRTVEALDTLASIMRNEDTPCGVRVAAAVALLDRGWGKPSQALEDASGDAVGTFTRIERTIVLAPQNRQVGASSILLENLGDDANQKTPLVSGEGDFFSGGVDTTPSPGVDRGQEEA